MATAADWRALVDKELAGASFDKTLVHRVDGLEVQPLYTEAPFVPTLPAGEAFKVCMRTTPERVTEELAAGAEAIWLDRGEAIPNVTTMIDDPSAHGVLVGNDPIARVVAGEAFATLRAEPSSVLVSTVPWHDAGADAVDEIAIALASGVACLREVRASALWLRVAVGRDTFGELCKVRALRLCWAKVVAATGGKARPILHAVTSSRTLTARDPWVNMLRVTTQMFAAILGGADLVTPAPFDAAIGADTALGRRVARNTGLVLREESYLGRIADPASGSYHLDTLTDSIARAAWRRFQAIEREGGIVKAIETKTLHARIEASWHERLGRIARRKEPILGVSEFAKLDEETPERRQTGTLPVHRDAEQFEALRDRGQGKSVTLVALGPPAEHRARVGFATNLFAAGGLAIGASKVACICGSDERYATEAATKARELKANGAARVILAGRPGALEGALKEAGVDDFVFVGCDAIAVLDDVIGALS